MLWLKEKKSKHKVQWSSFVSTESANEAERYILWCEDWLSTLEAEVRYRRIHKVRVPEVDSWLFTDESDAIKAMDIIRKLNRCAYDPFHNMTESLVDENNRLNTRLTNAGKEFRKIRADNRQLANELSQEHLDKVKYMQKLREVKSAWNTVNKHIQYTPAFFHDKIKEPRKKLNDLLSDCR